MSRPPEVEEWYNAGCPCTWDKVGKEQLDDLLSNWSDTSMDKLSFKYAVRCGRRQKLAPKIEIPFPNLVWTFWKTFFIVWPIAFLVVFGLLKLFKD